MNRKLVLAAASLAISAAALILVSGHTTVAAVPVRYLALGDSYTIGESVASSERWPAQLVESLRAHKVAVADPEIIAKTGWTTDELSTAIDAARPQGPYALVTLLIGVNHQYL